MKKKSVLAFTIAIAITSTSFASGIKYDSTKVRTNEISLNIAPVATGLMGASIFSPRYSLSYKKIVKEKNALRFGASYLVRNSEYYSYYNDNYSVLFSSDSVQMRRYFKYDAGNKIQISAGYELRWGKHKLKHFAGADVIGGYYKTRTTWEDKEYYLTITPNQGDTFPQWKQNTSIPVSLARETIAEMFYVGISPFYGVRLDISKRFAMSAQVGFDASFDFGNSTDNNYYAGTYTETKIISFNFETSGLISDLSLIYKF